MTPNDNTIDRDPLTGAMSRASFKQFLADSASDGNTPTHDPGWILLYADVDSMKRFNLHNGHSVGDVLLKDFVSLVESLLGIRTHSIFRVGGDKFAIILPGFGRDAAIQLSQQICDLFRERVVPPQPVHCGDPRCMGPAQVSVSIGIELSVQNMHTGNVIDKLDQKMYEARRRSGRGRVWILQ